MFDLKKLLEAGIAQINPWDDGKDWNSVYSQRPASRPQPAQTPAPKQQRGPVQTAQPRPGAFLQVPTANRGVELAKPLMVQQPAPVRVEKPKIEKKPESNPVIDGAKFLFENTAKLANTIDAGLTGAAGAVYSGQQKAFGTPAEYQAAVKATEDAFKEKLYGKGLLGAGSFFEQGNKLDNAALSGDIGAFARKTGGAGLGVAAEVAPMARGTQVLKAGAPIKQALPRLAVEGAAYGAAGNSGKQLTETGTVNPLETAQSAAVGGLLGPAVYLGGKAAGKGLDKLRNGQERVLASDPAEFLFGDMPQVAAARQATGRPAPAVTPAQGAQLKPAPNTRQRGFTSSVQQSLEVSPQARTNITPDRYMVRSTQELANEADTYARQPLKKVQADVNSRLSVDLGKVDDRTIADSIAVAKRLDENGDFDGANQIYERLAEHGTKGGQAIQAFSLLSNRTPEGMQFYAVRTLKKSGVNLSDEETQRLKGLISQVKKTEAGSEARKMATYQVAQFVNSKTPTGAADKAVNLWRAGLLTAPTTTAGNILGNATEAATRNLFVNPVATGADILMSLFTGQRSKTMAGGNLEGAKEGMEKLGTFLKTGYDERNVLDKFDVHQTKYGDSGLGRAAQGYTDSVYRLMGAADQPFYYAAKNQALKDLAGAEAINRGLKGADKDAFIREFMDNPPQNALDRAADSADQATYRDKTVLGESIKGAKERVRRRSETFAAGLDFVAPFTQVPASIATRIITRTPIGTATEVVKQIKSGKFDQRAMAEAIGNGTFGPTMMGVGYALANSGQMAFGYPEDTKEQELWRMEGKQPYSVKIGDRWYSLNYMQPFGTLMAMGGSIKDAVDQGEDVTSLVSQSLATAGQSVMNQSFLKGISGILDAIDDPKRYAENFWENTAGSAVPNFIRSGARSADPVQRDTNSALEGVMAGIPGLRQNLPAKTDAFGRPLEAKDNFVNQFINPLKPSVARGDDSVVNELRRLQDEDSGIVPSSVTRDALGKGTTITDQQMREIKESVGPQLYAAWEQVMSDPRYAAMSNEDKVRVLDRTKDTVAGAIKTQYGADKGIIDAKTAADKLNTKESNYLTKGSGDFIDQASKKANKTYADKYESALKNWNENSKDWSEVEKTTKAKELTRLEVQKDYDEDVIDLYQMSKADAFNFIQKAANGQELADKLVAYGDALVEKGVSAYSKYRNKNGAVSIAPATKKSGGSRKTGGKGRGSRGGGRRSTFKPSKSAQETGTTRRLTELRRNTKLTRRTS